MRGTLPRKRPRRGAVGEDLVQTAGLGYQLRADAARLDLVRFSELVAAGMRTTAPLTAR